MVNFSLDSDESSGTKKFFALAGPILDVLENGYVSYDGNGSKVISDDFFELLDSIDKKTEKKRVDLAMVRAERNYNRFNHTNPAREESSTTVFRLVKELLKYR